MLSSRTLLLVLCLATAATTATRPQHLNWTSDWLEVLHKGTITYYTPQGHQLVPQYKDTHQWNPQTLIDRLLHSQCTNTIFFAILTSAYTQWRLPVFEAACEACRTQYRPTAEQQFTDLLQRACSEENREPYLAALLSEQCTDELSDYMAGSLHKLHLPALRLVLHHCGAHFSRIAQQTWRNEVLCHTSDSSPFLAEKRTALLQAPTGYDRDLHLRLCSSWPKVAHQLPGLNWAPLACSYNRRGAVRMAKLDQRLNNGRGRTYYTLSSQAIVALDGATRSNERTLRECWSRSMWRTGKKAKAALQAMAEVRGAVVYLQPLSRRAAMVTTDGAHVAVYRDGNLFAVSAHPWAGAGSSEVRVTMVRDLHENDVFVVAPHETQLVSREVDQRGISLAVDLATFPEMLTSYVTMLFCKRRVPLSVMGAILVLSGRGSKEEREDCGSGVE